MPQEHNARTVSKQIVSPCIKQQFRENIRLIAEHPVSLDVAAEYLAENHSELMLKKLREIVHHSAHQE